MSVGKKRRERHGVRWAWGLWGSSRRAWNNHRRCVHGSLNVLDFINGGTTMCPECRLDNSCVNISPACAAGLACLLQGADNLSQEPAALHCKGVHVPGQLQTLLRLVFDGIDSDRPTTSTLFPPSLATWHELPATPRFLITVGLGHTRSQLRGVTGWWRCGGTRTKR